MKQFSAKQNKVLTWKMTHFEDLKLVRRSRSAMSASWALRLYHYLYSLEVANLCAAVDTLIGQDAMSVIPKTNLKIRIIVHLGDYSVSCLGEETESFHGPTSTIRDRSSLRCAHLIFHMAEQCLDVYCRLPLLYSSILFHCKAMIQKYIRTFHWMRHVFHP